MADRHRLGTFVNGRFTVALDLAPANGTFAVERDTFTVTAPAQTDIKARRARRYGGSLKVGEQHDNGNLAAQWFVKGANLQASLVQLDALIGILESSNATAPYYWEWRIDGAAYSVYFEIRGTSWEPLYRWVQTAGTGHLHVKLGVDIAPLALGDQLDIYDDFSVDTITAGDYTFDAGAAYTTVSGGTEDPLASVPTYYDDAVLADSPALYWRSIGTGGATDASGNSHAGTSSGSPTTTAAVPTAEPLGNTDTALVLDGVNDLVEAVGYVPFVNGTVRTFEGWAYRNTSTTSDALMGSPGGATNGALLYLETPGNDVYFFPTLSGTNALWAGAWPGTGQWVHWALVFDEPGDTVELFINGASQGVKALTAQWGTGPGNLQIGHYQGGAYWDGKVAKFAVYNAGLSAARIAAHYAATAGGGTYNDERRARHTTRGYTHTDAQVTHKATPGATINGFKAGALLRANSSTYLEAYVDDNGTNSRLRIDKVIAGVRTNLATTNLGARIATGVPVWVRGRIEGTIVNAEAFTTEPTLSGTASSSLSYTLSTAEQAAAPSGFGGWSWVPMDGAATIDDFRVEPYTYKNRALPEVIDLKGVPGTAPARFDLSIGQPASNPRIEPWGLLGWTTRPPVHSYVWNGDFEDANLGVTGWGVGAVAGVIGAATSISRITTAARARNGTGSGQIVTPATTDTGASFPLYRRFKKGVLYTVVAYLSAATDTTPARVKLGVSGDLAVSAAAALTPTPTAFTTTWTPTADTDVAYMAAGINAATATTFSVDAVQVFEGTVAPTVGRHAQGAGAKPPFGILQAEAAIPSTLTGWAITASGGALGGYDLDATATTFQAEWLIDPTLAAADDFTTDIMVDVYARIFVNAAAAAANATLTATPESNAAQRIPTNEWGSTGKPLVLPSAGGAWRMVKLGTIPFPVDPANPSRWRLRLAVLAAGAAQIAVDYLIMVPARQRALGATAKANDSSYPALFHASGVEEVKVIRSDLSGRYSQPPGVLGRDSGLGGQLLEFPAPPPGATSGDVQTVLKLSDVVPDDPTSSAYAEAGITVTGSAHYAVQPRYTLARSG